MKDEIKNKLIKIEKLKNHQDDENENENKNENENEIKIIQNNIIDIKKKLKKKEKGNIKVTSKEIYNCKKLFDIMNIQYIQGNTEADIICAHLVKNNIVNACLSEDMDLLTHGCTILIKNFNYKNDNIDIYNLNNIIQNLNINKESFIDLCILCGCDYTCKIKGIGNITALKFIKKYQNIENIIKFIKDNNIKKYKINDEFKYENARNIFNIDYKLENFEIKKFNNFNLNNLNLFLEKNEINYNFNKLKKIYNIN